MKKLFTLVSILAFGSTMFAQQVVLTHKVHGLAPDNIMELKQTDFTEPGNGGKNQVWDLRSLENSNDFNGFVAPARDVDPSLQFQQANIVLTEEGTRFFFCQEEEVLSAWGTMTKTGRVLKKYSRPYIKMKYPFSYGDEFSGDYDGIFYQGDNEVPLAGSYHVKADGYGKLRLPGETEVNALRVVTNRSYDLMLESGTQTFEILTYRWYSNNERFPLAVFQITRSSVCNPDGDYNYRAFYRLPQQSDEQSEEPSESILKSEQDFVRVYPNPVKNHFRMEYSVDAGSDVFIELFDNSGNKVAILVDQYKKAGYYSESFSAKNYSLKHGVYHLRGLFGDQISRTTFIIE